jgi:two-component system C4-dicarboxylate transport sensor histidine kinase DctB
MKLLAQTRIQLLAAYIIFGLSVAGLASVVYHNTLHRELLSLREEGSVRLSEASSRLRLQVDGYRALANVIAKDVQVVEALENRQFTEAKRVLETFEATYGAWRIDLTDTNGQFLINSAGYNSDPKYPRALLRAAENNRLGFGQALEDGERIIRLSRGVLVKGQRPKGMIVVNVSLAALEFEWPVSPEAIVFFDVAEIVFSSNRPDLLYLSRSEDPELAAFDLVAMSRSRALQLWRFRPPDGSPLEVIKTEKFIPHLELTGVIFLETRGARATASLAAILVLAGAVVLGLIGTVALQQRRRRMLEETYSSQLEDRVEDRSLELRGAQDALVEASKLAALGRLSAGVSHELNQPLAAILNFAENGQKFLAQSKPDPAAQNFTLISDQVRRMIRIISNLRTFARQEIAPTERVDFGEVVASALDLMCEDIKAAGVTLRNDLPDAPTPVLAGNIRLQQVVLNLLTNALDAMASSERKVLSLILYTNEKNSVLTVTDTGHGIDDPSSVFEPFYTTKDLGASKGLGMGLALSHGIVMRFGGTLNCYNLDDGAEFELALPILKEDNA